MVCLDVNGLRTLKRNNAFSSSLKCASGSAGWETGSELQLEYFHLVRLRTNTTRWGSIFQVVEYVSKSELKEVLGYKNMLVKSWRLLQLTSEVWSCHCGARSKTSLWSDNLGQSLLVFSLFYSEKFFILSVCLFLDDPNIYDTFHVFGRHQEWLESVEYLSGCPATCREYLYRKNSFWLILGFLPCHTSPPSNHLRTTVP